VIGLSIFAGSLEISMSVDFFSFNYAPISLRIEWLNRIEEVINGGIFIGGAELEKFELEWAKYTDSRFALGVANGLDGLTLALRALNIGEGDVVAVPAHTFIASWSAVISVGAIPIGIDVDAQGLIDLEQLQKVKSKISAVMPVHMHGSTVDMRILSQICSNSEERDKVFIIEDASQAHGSRYPSGEKIGSYSDVAVYSCYPTKNLGALGDGGIITTNQEDAYRKILLMRSYGSRPEDKYNHEILGYNSRLDPMQAAILRINLEYLDKWNDIRRELSEIYIDELANNIEILQLTRTDSVRHHMCILTPRRNELKKYLSLRNIMTEIHYPNVAGTEALKYIGTTMNFEKSQQIADQTLSLPISQWHTPDQIYEVIKLIQEWLSK
jgi:dTDP-4-amino-4,6-dideoxygalactose transaminase